MFIFYLWWVFFREILTVVKEKNPGLFRLKGNPLIPNSNCWSPTVQEVHKAARIHTQMSKGTAGATADYRPQGGALPVISPELTSELLHCLSTLPDPWPLAKITIDMEKPSQWVSKLCRLYAVWNMDQLCVSLYKRLFDSLCSCNDRASERHRPNSRKKTTQYGTEGTWNRRQDTRCGNSELIPSRPLGRNLPFL